MINKNQEKDNYNKFYQLFNPMMPSVQKLKRAGHLVSFMTQFFALMQIFVLNMPIQFKILLYLISFFIAIFLSAIIEKGIANFFPYIINQLLNWQFQNKWFKAMFFMVLGFIVFPLMIASPTLSAIGGNEIANNLITTDERPQTEFLEKEEAKKTSQTDSIFNASLYKISLEYDKQIQSITKAYNSKISIEQDNIDKYKKVYDMGGKWAIEHIRNSKNKIEKLKSELAEKEAATLSEKIATIKNLEQSRHNTITNIQKNKNIKIENITTDWLENKQKIETKKTIWGYVLGFFAAFGVLCTIVCIIIVGIYEKGAEGAIIDQEEQKTGSFKATIFEDLVSKIFDFLPISKAESGKEKAEEERPQIGFFNHKSGKEKAEEERPQIGFFNHKSGKEKAESLQLEITNEAESGIGKSGKNPEEISAFSKKAEAKKAESKSGSTSQKFAAFQKKAEVVKAEVNEKKSGSFSNKKPVEKTRDSVIKTKAFLMNKNGKVTQHEVAEILSISERTVRKYWHD